MTNPAARVSTWFRHHQNLALLARYMIERGDDAADVLYMLEKPWKYEPEWLEAVALELDGVALIVGEYP